MEDFLRSIRAYLYEKSVSPLAGAFVLAWLILNYRVVVVLISGGHYDDKFAVIDQYFYVSVTENSVWINELVGRILRGLVYPAVLALTYIFVYPYAAAPVYDFVLQRRQKLREIKQKAENARILTVKESRDLYKQLVDMEALYNEETDRYQRQVAALQETIRDLENEIETMPASAPAFDDGHGNEADIEEYDGYIDKTIAERAVGEFTLADIFTASRWQSFPVPDRQQLGKRFKARVDRGDFVGVVSVGRNARNEAIYEKVDTSDFLQQPIDRETVAAYTKKKFPDLPIDQNVQELFIRDLDHERYRVLRDIDKVISQAEPGVNAYKAEAPDLFKAGTDFITKSFGFVDADFRARHAFGTRTRQAFSKFESLLKPNGT